MPDPILYFKVMIVAASVSALCALTLVRMFRVTKSHGVNFANIFGIALGLAAGYYFLQLHLNWPPTNGLDRLLLVVVPASISIEIIAGLGRLPLWIAWCLRLGLAAITGRVLLHGSVYLGGPRSEWTVTQAALVLTLCGLLLITEWAILSWLSRRGAPTTISISLSLALQCAAITIMLAGYVAGGAAALPLVAAILGATTACGLIATRVDGQGTIGIGLVGLFGLLFIGRFFGALSTLASLTIFTAPLICGVMELPFLKRQNRWLAGTLCLLLVAMPLVVIVIFAKQHFDQYTAPLV